MAEQILPAAADTPLWRIRLRLLDDKVRSNWALFVQTKIGLIGLGIIGFYLLLVVAYPVLMNTVWSPAVYDPVIGFDHSQTSQPAPPSIKHPLGTDPLGRDVLSQLMASTRSEFMLGVFAALVTVIVATSVGAVSAYFGEAIDMLFMRLADLMIMMPIISLLVVLGGFHNIGLLELGLVIGVLSGFGTAAVVVKSQALGVKVNPYVEAARSAGIAVLDDPRRVDLAVHGEGGFQLLVGDFVSQVSDVDVHAALLFGSGTPRPRQAPHSSRKGGSYAETVRPCNSVSDATPVWSPPATKRPIWSSPGTQLFK